MVAEQLRTTKHKHSEKLVKRICLICGEERWVNISNTRRPHFTGICRSCRNATHFPVYNHLSGADNPCWKDGRTRHGDYWKVMVKGHPRANKQGYVYEHIVVWERAHNKLLPKGWVVHHLNGIKDDNRPENLVAMPKNAHARLAEPYQKRIRELEATKAILIERLKNA
jgi:hypothetical protein